MPENLLARAIVSVFCIGSSLFTTSISKANADQPGQCAGTTGFTIVASIRDENTETLICSKRLSNQNGLAQFAIASSQNTKPENGVYSLNCNTLSGKWETQPILSGQDVFKSSIDLALVRSGFLYCNSSNTGLSNGQNDAMERLRQLTGMTVNLPQMLGSQAPSTSNYNFKTTTCLAAGDGVVDSNGTLITEAELVRMFNIKNAGRGDFVGSCTIAKAPPGYVWQSCGQDDQGNYTNNSGAKINDPVLTIENAVQYRGWSGSCLSKS
jgi:hypothetical protein